MAGGTDSRRTGVATGLGSSPICPANYRIATGRATILTAGHKHKRPARLLDKEAA